jgi:outer membrane immunogenic protein
MRHFHCVTLAAVAIGFASVASAADLPVKAPVYKAAPVPVYSWTGCYAGANVGGAFSRQDAGVSVPAVSDQAPDSATLKGSSAIGGVQVGCNWQFASSWVAGVEGDWSATNLDDTASFPNLLRSGAPVGNGGITFSHTTKWLASLRGRLGVAVVPNTLLYVTGGGAWAKTNYNGTDIFNGGCAVGNCATTSFSSTNGGWVVGAGAEWAPWSNNWLFRFEYLYYSLQGASATPFRPLLPGGSPTFNWSDLNVSEVRVGVSFKFN